MCLFNLKFNLILCFSNIKTQVYTTPQPRCIYLCPDIYGIYHLVWVTKVALAATCLVFPVPVLGYKLFNVSMYHVPVPT